MTDIRASRLSSTMRTLVAIMGVFAPEQCRTPYTYALKGDESIYADKDWQEGRRQLVRGRSAPGLLQYGQTWPSSSSRDASAPPEVREGGAPHPLAHNLLTDGSHRIQRCPRS